MRFLLVDRIVSWEPGGPLRGVKCVSMSEDVLEHHFPGNPIMPGSLLLEAMIQLAGWGEAARSDFQSWFLMDRVRRVAFYGFARPGDTIDLEVTPMSSPSAVRRAYRAVGSVAGSKKILAEIEGPVVPVAELADAAAVRDMFARLTRAREW